MSIQALLVALMLTIGASYLGTWLEDAGQEYGVLIKPPA
jgi:hypothetical protein